MQSIENKQLQTLFYSKKQKMQINEISYLDKCSLAVFSGIAMSFSNPFDLVRFRMQATPELIRQQKISQPYKSISQCAKTIYHQEGLRSFWKGNTSNLLRYYPNQSMNFFFKNFYQSIFQKSFQSYKNKDIMFLNSLGGSLGGITTRLLLYPLDYSRTRMANDITKRQGGIIRTLFDTVKKEGLSGIYRGALISFAGITIFRGTYFGIYDSFKSSSYHQLQKWALSYFSYVMATFLTYPSDTVRRRLMMTSCADYKYKGFMDCFKNIVKKQGFRSLFRGGNIIFLQAMSGSTIYYIFDKIFSSISAKH